MADNYLEYRQQELSDAQKKEYEYLAVSIITLLTRSAVAGGARRCVFKAAQQRRFARRPHF